MAEIALAHFIGSDVERAYQRSDMFERPRAMMADRSAQRLLSIIREHAWKRFSNRDILRLDPRGTEDSRRNQRGACAA
jgi:hypothetical protein